MAEAHEAVAFAFQITHDGVDVNFDREVLKLVWHSGLRSYKKRLARFKNSVRAGVYPAPLSSWVLTFAVTRGLSAVGVDFFGFIHFLMSLSPLNVHLFGLPLAWLVSCSIVATLWWICVILFFRYGLKLLLMYKGMPTFYTQQGYASMDFRSSWNETSLTTKLWMMCLRPLANVTKPMLYSYQQSLPRLPLPSLEGTLERFLRSLKPLETAEEFAETTRLAEEFRLGLGKKLQRYVWLKSWFVPHLTFLWLECFLDFLSRWSTNYVSDWWEEYVYLRGRSPLMVNSNFYCIDMLMEPLTNVQAARAASMIYGALLFRRLLDRQELEPIMIYSMVPLCSSQYERLFNTTRVPGVESDTIVHRADADHIAVLHKGRIFKVLVYHRGRLLKPCEIEMQLQKILDNPVDPADGEAKLPALTAGDREHWSNTREKFFSKGVNRISLNAVESAAFVVTLDDKEFYYDPKDHTKLDKYAHQLLTGSGCDKWFDKTFNLVVAKNARIGFNAEHSWADAPVMGHLWEYMLATEVVDLKYKEDGHCDGEPAFHPPEPVKLKWQLPPECIDNIEFSYKVARGLADDLDLRLYVHDEFGKGAIKKCRLSPDAFVQMALQLASYRDSNGKFSLTYEASMTRMYREGRTETVRSCSIESCAFVLAMENPESTPSERYKLLKDACDRHQLSYQAAMVGEGVDRHLFCLYVVSRYLDADSPFLKRVLSQPWRLSTSQTPHGQTSKLDLRKNPHWISAGGGFGPVTDDGYGVSYIVAGEDVIFFHISSKRSCNLTDSTRFAENIRKALLDIRDLCGSEIKRKTKKDEANGAQVNGPGGSH
ncbi:unnamed protein product [Notodromas monacha]|uniref:carnitine O-palmitoyltransferase n=1 Tax=Notodromas monacha TaxID=399045 RepID=A0A7R9GFW2_9CRUS|nr:unnamed protein product [Notodromas monacha]CAG0921197.1 unnamed protein product [Notodromas monacha]